MRPPRDLLDDWLLAADLEPRPKHSRSRSSRCWQGLAGFRSAVGAGIGVHRGGCRHIHQAASLLIASICRHPPRGMFIKLIAMRRHSRACTVPLLFRQGSVSAAARM